MQIVKALKFLVIITSINLSACAETLENPYFQAGAIGALGGVALGAGTGALVGSLISNGDIGQSALLGGALGLPLGIIAGVAYRSYQEDREIQENNETIRANYEYIIARQYEIDRTREDLVDESFRIQPNKRLKSDIYTGPSIGTYNR